MQKTKLGISVGLLGSAMYFFVLFGSSVNIVAVVLAGYILLFEGNAWLRRSAVKAMAIMLTFSFLTTLIYFVPEIIGVISDIAGIFGGMFYVSIVSNITEAMTAVIYLIEDILLVVLGLKALTQGTVYIPIVDSLIDKHM